jgi:hypothetical protein
VHCRGMIWTSGLVCALALVGPSSAQEPWPYSSNAAEISFFAKAPGAKIFTFWRMRWATVGGTYLIWFRQAAVPHDATRKETRFIASKQKWEEEYTGLLPTQNAT